MAIKFHLIKAGDNLYTKRSHNTVYPVRVIAVSAEAQTVLASVNNNPARDYSKRNAEKWYRLDPSKKSH